MEVRNNLKPYKSLTDTLRKEWAIGVLATERVLRKLISVSYPEACFNIFSQTASKLAHYLQLSYSIS